MSPFFLVSLFAGFYPLHSGVPTTCTFNYQGAEIAVRYLQSYGMMPPAVDTIWVNTEVPGMEETRVDSMLINDKRFFIAYNDPTPGRVQASFSYSKTLDNNQLQVKFKSSQAGKDFQGNFIFSCEEGHLAFVACRYYSAID